MAELCAPREEPRKNEICSAGVAKAHEILESQVYFGIPSNIVPEVGVATEETVIKFGSTKEPEVRILRHRKDFGGFRLLDSVAIDNPIVVEDKIRDWLKINGKLIKGKTDNKQTTETELFVVKDQEEYESIVRLTKFFADDYKNQIMKKYRDVVDLEKKQLETEKEILLSKMAMLRA